MFAYGRGPNRRGEVGVVFKAGDDVPMQVGHNIAEAGQIDFGRVEDLAHCGFNLIHHFHDFVAFGRGKVGHLGNMVIPNNAAECGCAGFVVDGDDAQVWRLQQNVFVVGSADGAGHGFFFLSLNRNRMIAIRIFRMR